jgi:hypothetical protein
MKTTTKLKIKALLSGVALAMITLAPLIAEAHAGGGTRRASRRSFRRR